MTAKEVGDQSRYFRNGYYDGSHGFSIDPPSSAEKGSYSYTEYLKGHSAGKEDS
jgi:hypothetical protein